MVDLVIRAALDSDVDWIMSRFRMASEFYGTHHSLYGYDEYVKKNLLDVIENHVFFIAEKKGNRVGYIGGFYSPHFFNPEFISLSQCFWWVDPEHRRGRATKLLLDTFVEFGEEFADWVTISTHSGTDIKDKHFEKRGFHLKEKKFLKEIVRGRG